MKICNFTQAELDTFRSECNFTDLELRCFELKAKDCTDVQLALKLSISKSTAAVTMRQIPRRLSQMKKKVAKDGRKNVNCIRGVL